MLLSKPETEPLHLLASLFLGFSPIKTILFIID